MKLKHKKKAIICTVSELATDYRLHKLAGTITEAGFEVAFLCRKKKNLIPSKSSNYKTTYLNTIWQKGPLFYLFFNIRIFFFLIFKKQDLIVSVDLDTLVGCGSTRLFKKSKLLFDSHEYFPEVPEIQHKLWIKNIWLTAEKCFIPAIDHGVTVCQPIADLYQKKYDKEFLIIRNAPLANRISTSVQKQKDPNHTFTILYQGAVNHGRALRELIMAMKYVSDAKLLIIGGGDILKELQELASDQSERIKFTGKIPFEQLPKYTKQADLGISLLENIGLNNYYALPNRLFDAIQAQLPMLGINFPEIEKFIHENDFGTTISSIEPEKIAKAINNIKDNPEQLKKWRINASIAQKKIYWENEVIELTKILEKI